MGNCLEGESFEVIDLIIEKRLRKGSSRSMKICQSTSVLARFGVVLCCLFMTAKELAAESRVFLLAGQSNMAGAGLFEKLKKSDQKRPEGVKIWNKGVWTELGPGISANEGRFGPELAFGRAMRKAFPDDEIYLIKTASGGTSMHKHWTVEGKGSPMLKKFLASARGALADLDKSKVKYQVEGMLWMQGESDAAQGKGAEYEESLVKFIKAMRKEFKERKMPFLMGRILPTFDKPKGHGPMVRAALEKVAAEDENVACFNTDDFARLNKGHYDHEGQLELGKAFAEHFLKIRKAAEEK